MISPLERLHTLPRERLVSLPTPLDHAERLGRDLGVDLFVKRDDLTGLGCGGNKLRKLEFILGEALRNGVDTLLTTGGAQSNHARLTAAVAARAGLACELHLKGDRPATFAGNLLLDALFGATVSFCGVVPYSDIYVRMEDRASELRRSGRQPMLVPLGGATAVGTSGYVLAFKELLEQMGNPSNLTVAVSGGTGSTAAGLAVGAALFAPQTRLVVVSASWTEDVLGTEFARLFAETAALLGVPDLKPGNVLIDSGHVGPGYATPSPAGCAAVRRMAEREGIVLDTTYTGKALAGLLSLLDQGDVSKYHPLVFVHTGGIPEIFTRNTNDLGV